MTRKAEVNKLSYI